MGKRRDARVLALKTLYIFELIGDGSDNIMNDIADIEGIDDKHVIEYADNIISKVIMYTDVMNNMIESCTKNWTIGRMAILDRNILRIAMTEIFLQEGVPDVVAIDEAIEMAKEFSTEDSGGFVNGILDHIIKNKEEFDRKLKQ